MPSPARGLPQQSKLHSKGNVVGSSSLLGGQRARLEPQHRDTAALGPSDSCDSGSDVTGLDFDEGDPNLPVDVALRGEARHPLMSADILDAGPAPDMAGTGERRSASANGPREAADISVDRVFRLGGPGENDEDDEDDDPDLGVMDEVEDEPDSPDDDDDDGADPSGTRPSGTKP